MKLLAEKIDTNIRPPYLAEARGTITIRTTGVQSPLSFLSLVWIKDGSLSVINKNRQSQRLVSQCSSTMSCSLLLCKGFGG